MLVKRKEKFKNHYATCGITSLCENAEMILNIPIIFGTYKKMHFDGITGVHL
jgi:hypothetical protein